jgi:hypothetical protein
MTIRGQNPVEENPSIFIVRGRAYAHGTIRGENICTVNPEQPTILSSADIPTDFFLALILDPRTDSVIQAR